MTYLLLFYEFFRTGLFAVGGGMATLPFLEEIAGKHPEWFDTKMLADMIAVSESTPGPIGVNMATYAGYSAGYSEGNIFAGILGGIIATFALVLPSVIVVILVAKFLSQFSENKYVNSVFYGLRPAVAGLISAAGFSVIKTALYVQGETFLTSFNYVSVIIFICFIILMQLKPLKKLHPIVYIILAAILGIIFKIR